MLAINEYWSKWTESFEIYTKAVAVSKIKLLLSH